MSENYPDQYKIEKEFENHDSLKYSQLEENQSDSEVKMNSSSNPLNPFKPSKDNSYPSIDTQKGLINFESTELQNSEQVSPMPPLKNVKETFKWSVSRIQAKLIRFERRQLVLVIVFIAIFLDNMLLTTVGMILSINVSKNFNY